MSPDFKLIWGTGDLYLCRLMNQIKTRQERLLRN